MLIVLFNDVAIITYINVIQYMTLFAESHFVSTHLELVTSSLIFKVGKTMPSWSTYIGLIKNSCFGGVFCFMFLSEEKNNKSTLGT